MKYKYELHTHTKYGSRQCGRTEPKDIARMYKEKGYSGIVLTDHYSPLTFDLAHGYFNPKKFIDCYIDPYLEMKKYIYNSSKGQRKSKSNKKLVIVNFINYRNINL